MPETETARRMVELTTPYFSHSSTAMFQKHVCPCNMHDPITT